MDSPGAMLNDLTARIVADRSAAQDFVAGRRDCGADQAMAEAAIPLAMATEQSGGFALPPQDVLPLLRAVGGFAATLPIAERLQANWLLSLAGLPLADATVAPVTRDGTIERAGEGWRVRASLPRVPWASLGDHIVFLIEAADGPRLVSLPSNAVQALIPGVSLAGEPRDDLVVDAVVADADLGRLPEGYGALQWRANGAAIRCQLIAGAAARVLQQTIQYVGERRQFGQPLARFQAIQHQLAVVAGEVAAAAAAADAAAAAFGVTPDLVAIAAAKVRCGEAASVIAPIVHQVHGAIGFTEEHVLHRLTKQLWAWRDEYGRESTWSEWLGHWTLTIAADGLWPALVPLEETAHG